MEGLGRAWSLFLFCFLLLIVAEKRASLHLLSVSLFGNIESLVFGGFG